jgi:hypothetical protein|tara:strand:- start:164 stop:301 length:138 start_codon:yes stop_codon:yes gene_type:complete
MKKEDVLKQWFEELNQIQNKKTEIDIKMKSQNIETLTEIKEDYGI